MMTLRPGRGKGLVRLVGLPFDHGWKASHSTPHALARARHADYMEQSARRPLRPTKIVHSFIPAAPARCTTAAIPLAC